MDSGLGGAFDSQRVTASTTGYCSNHISISHDKPTSSIAYTEQSRCNPDNYHSHFDHKYLDRKHLAPDEFLTFDFAFQRARL